MTEATARQKLELIIAEVRPGESINFAELGRHFGVSRQRISKLVKKIGMPEIVPEGFLPAEEAAKVLGYRRKSLWKFAAAGRIQKVKFKNRTYWNVGGFAVKACSVCGKPLPKGRVNKCSDRCRQAATYASRKKRQWKRWNEKEDRDKGIHVHIFILGLRRLVCPLIRWILRLAGVQIETNIG